MHAILKRALALMSLLGLIGTASLLMGIDATLVRADDAKTNKYLPHLADLMNEAMQVHHIKLWFAGHAENWALAGYEVKKIKETIDEIKETIVDIQTASSLWQRLPVNEMLGNLDFNLNAVDQAVTTKNSAKFLSAYQAFTAACNACHEAASQPQIKIIQPLGNGGSPFADQDFATGNSPQ
jgi:hypothetical protein